MGTCLADHLQDVDGGAKVSDVKDGQRQVQVAKVADALVQPLAAGLAHGVLRAYSHPAIQDSIGNGLALGLVQILRDNPHQGFLLDFIRAADSKLHM